MSVKEQYWKYSLITIILGLGLILFTLIPQHFDLTLFISS